MNTMPTPPQAPAAGTKAPSPCLAAVIFFTLLSSPARAENAGKEAVQDERGRILLEISPDARKTDLLPLREVFARYGVSQPQFMRMSMDWDYLPNQCGEDRIYFLTLKFRGNCRGEDCALSLALQTLTFAHLERLYKEIKKNFHKKGLPACLFEKDSFWESAWDRVWMTQTFQPDLALICSPSPGRGVWMPVTRCIHEANLY